MAASTLISFSSKHCFQPLPPRHLPLFFTAPCSLTSCLFIRQDGWMFLKYSKQDGTARRMIEISKSGNLSLAKFAARPDRSFEFQRNTLRSSLPSFIPPRIININIFGLQSVQGHWWGVCEIPDEVAAPREKTVNSKESTGIPAEYV